MAYVAPYLTATDAQSRLAAYSITATPTEMQLILASDELDRKGGFIGERYSETQLRAFPRTETVSGDTEGVVPDRVLDWVAITAYELSELDEPPVKHERIESLSITFTRGRRSQPWRFKRFLLSDYRRSSSIKIVR